MRRRDANGNHSLQIGGGRPSTTAVAVVLSLAVHAGALLALAAVCISNASTPPPLRVSLLSGGGDGPPGRKGGATDSEARPESGQKAPADPAREQLAPQQHRRSRLPKAKPAAMRKSLRPHNGSVAPPASVTTAPLAAAAESDTTDGVGSRDGAGAGAGPDGSGPGWGHGGGSGDGGLDARASCAYCPPPHYPLIARARGWQGTVEVLLSVLADGSVNTATLWRSSGYSVLDQAAVAAAQHSRFTPPRESTPLHGRMEYRFELVTAR
jgi:TonB family protein